jgi:hypothetical protein
MTNTTAGYQTIDEAKCIESGVECVIQIDGYQLFQKA